MLRWCQSTLRTLDGHGCNYASNFRHYSSPPRAATLAQLAKTDTRSHYDKSTGLRDGKCLVAQTVGAQPEPNSHRKLYEQPKRQSALHGTSAELQVENGSYGASRSSVLNTHSEKQGGASPSKAGSGLHAKALTSRSRSSHTSHPHSPDNHITQDPIATLQQLLSPNTSHEGRFITDIFTLYENASNQSVLFNLGGEEFTNLLSLFGTLSLTSTETRLAYDNPLASQFQSSLAKPNLWSFILKVGEDKEKFGFELGMEDRYWIMQACLARAQIAGERSRPAITRARTQYQRLKEMTDDPDFHLPYLKFLMSSGNPRQVQEAVRYLCEILQRISDPHPRFPEFLWETILLHAPDLLTDMKEQISQIAFNRVAIRPKSLGIIKSPVPTPDIIRPGILRMPHLSAALAASLFPNYIPHYPRDFLCQWAIQQARQALSPNLPLDIRWSNLTLLAVSMFPETFPVKYRSSNTASPDSGNSLWRTTLILENMDRKLSRGGQDFGALCQTVQSIVRPLWKMFSTAKHAEQPVDINRAYIAAFFRIAAKSYDEQLKEACFHLSQRLGLWHYLQNDAQTTKAQAVDTIAAYVTAFVSCEGRDWPGLYSTISSLLPGIDWQADVTNVLLGHYASENVSIAYDLYVHSLGNGISVSSRAIHELFVGLVIHQRWDIVTLFLEHPTTSRDHVELLFGESLRVFQVQRYEYADAAFVKLLGRTACKLYEHERPPPSLKYPIRYFFSMMIWTQNSSDLVNIVKAIHRTVPSLFTTHLVHRLVLQLVRRQDLSNALKLFRIFEEIGGSSMSRSLDDIRHKLMFNFFKLGAHKLAGQLSRTNNQIGLLVERDDPAHASGRRVLGPSSLYFRHILSVVARADSHGPTIREAVSLLIRAKRFYSARKLYAKTYSRLDSKTSTAVGNIILHGPMLNHDFRHGRLVRHILRTQDLLSKQYGFVPDRATVNIILKAILRWKTMLDAKKVRNLFDTMVHEGYPVPEQFRRTHGVPFNSPRSSSGLSIPSLSIHISFSKHVRPMYKMFIKAFYLRGDASAAKTVVGILKEVEIQEMREREKRSRARREGVIKKKMRELKKEAGAGP